MFAFVEEPSFLLQLGSIVLLDLLLAEAGVDRFAICTARLYLQDVRGEIGAVNAVWKEYFGSHPVCRRAYGVELQTGMRVEAAFTAEIP